MTPERAARGASRRRPGTFAIGGLLAVAVLAGGTHISQGIAWQAPRVTHHGAPTSSAAVAPLGVTLLSQTPWIKGRGVFRLHLSVRARNPSVDTLDILTYLRLSTRTDFDNALNGKYNSISWYDRYIPVNTLTSDPSGIGYDIDIPVNQPSTGSQLPTFDAEAGSAVFPMDISVRDANGTVEGGSITTFMVWAWPPSVSSYPRLSVSVLVPVSSQPNVTAKAALGPPSPSDSLRLSELAGALDANPHVPVTLQAVPQTLDALQAGTSTDRDTLADLAAVAGRGSEVLPSTYSGEQLGDLSEAGLPDEGDRQLTAGQRTLTSLLAAPAAQNTWALTGPTSAVDVANLLAKNMTGLIVPDSELTPLPASVTWTTFALTTGLSFPGAQGLTTMAIDPGITADFVRSVPPVLAANQLLAELAMIQTEAPANPRGVVVAPPAGWVTSAQLYSTLLAGLAGNPLLSAMTATKLLGTVPRANNLSRALVPNDPGSPGESDLAADAPQIRAARTQLTGLVSITPVAAGQVDVLDKRLFVAASSTVTEAEREALLGGIATTTYAVTREISLPGSSSITLTSTHSSIPLTILSNPALRARVRLTLASQRLIFQPYHPPQGTCQLTTSSSEVCVLVLVNENTTLKVPVQTRASGIFPLDVGLYSADGSLLLARDQDTIRSTAVSGVGIVLIALALLGLAVWWIRDLRRGRRARSLVPSPVADSGAPDPEEQLVPDR